MANFLAIAIVLNIIESAIPVIPVPGAKLGFANVVTLIVLYVYSFKDSSIITLSRVFLVALLTGKLLGPVFYMSFAGSVLAMLAMGLFKKSNFFGILGVSVLGSVFHCIGQVIGGYFVIGSTAIILYLPIMLFLSIPAGVVTGLIAQRFLKVWETWNKDIQ
ncbi:MAG TPA: Gx transporter family protein [Acholeplasmataceae bacterium]|nr:Gx transporter family protein [Acholeplasmataceae bacterium]